MGTDVPKVGERKECKGAIALSLGGGEVTQFSQRPPPNSKEQHSRKRKGERIKEKKKLVGDYEVNVRTESRTKKRAPRTYRREKVTQKGLS